MTEPSTDDEQASYKFATQAVDDAFRMDTFGPKIEEVVEKYKPVSDAIENITEHALKNNSKVRDEVTKIIDEHKTNTKGKGLTQTQTFVVNALITAVITSIIVALFIKFGIPQK